MINSDEALNVGHREGKSTRLMKSWLRTHRPCAGGGGFALLSGQRSPKQNKSEAVVLVRATEVRVASAA